MNNSPEFCSNAQSMFARICRSVMCRRDSLHRSPDVVRMLQSQPCVPVNAFCADCNMRETAVLAPARRLCVNSPLKKVTRRVSEGFESAILADFRPSLTRRVTTNTVFQRAVKRLSYEKTTPGFSQTTRLNRQHLTSDDRC